MIFEFSKHALEQMELRRIPKDTVRKILAHPEQIKDEEGETVYQSIADNYLIRVFVNDKKNPKLIITVYKTSKIKKYYESKI
ncbi:MAG: DUF4258 domain-containing protein [Bacteroidota bacterium]